MFVVKVFVTVTLLVASIGYSVVDDRVRQVARGGGQVSYNWFGEDGQDADCRGAANFVSRISITDLSGRGSLALVNLYHADTNARLQYTLTIDGDSQPKQLTIADIVIKNMTFVNNSHQGPPIGENTFIFKIFSFYRPDELSGLGSTTSGFYASGGKLRYFIDGNEFDSSHEVNLRWQGDGNGFRLHSPLREIVGRLRPAGSDVIFRKNYCEMTWQDRLSS